MGVIEKYGLYMAEAAVRYLNLWSWFSKKMSASFGKTCLHTFDSTNELWDKILAGSVHAYDQIVLRDVFITEWIPRVPGAAHLPSTTPAITDQLGYSTSFRDGLRRITSGSVSVTTGSRSNPPNLFFGNRTFNMKAFGSVRLPLIPNSTFPVLLGVVGAEPFFCDSGIPILTSQAVYRDFLRHRIGSNSLAAKLTTRLFLSGEPPAKRVHAKSSMALSDALIDVIERAIGLPEYYLVLDSPLDVTFLAHDSHPLISAWTIAQTTGPLPLHIMAALCDPSDKDDLHAAVKDIVSHSYMDKSQAIETSLTEFDGMARHFKPVIPLSTDPLLSSRSAIKELLGSVEKCLQITDDLV